MNMETNEDSCDSLPYIDDVPTGDEDTPPQYNLKITENYRNKNRDIKISKRSPTDVPEHSDPRQPEVKATGREMRAFASSGMKLVIRGCNSSISIQGLDNQSSITFRRCEKAQKGVEESLGKANAEEGRPKRRRWKMLTKSLMLARSARVERRGVDERYPKYVLLKNEEDDVNSVKENYPKMFVFDERKHKGKSAFKPDFNLKKSFKNKTEPIVPMEEILAKAEERRNRKSSEAVKPKQKQPLTARCRNENKNSSVERRKSLAANAGCPPPKDIVCGEIQGIFEHALNLLPPGLDVHEDESRPECSPAIPPQFYHFPCQDQFCRLGAPDQAPRYIPASCPPQYVAENPNAQTVQRPEAGGADLENLPYGFLSSFFPRVVIMNAIRSEDLTAEEAKQGVVSNSDYASSRPEAKEGEGSRAPQDAVTESKPVQQPPKAVPEDSCLSDVSLKESSDEELKTKTQESETITEYLHYDEFTEATGNEAAERKNFSTPPPLYESKESATKTFSPPKAHKSQRGEENLQNLSLTKVGYKMYDSLTKLSLNRDKDGAKRAEMSGCGCNGNEAKKSPCNITFESSSSVVKVTVPEKELNLQIVNSLGADIQIGVKSGGGGGAKTEEGERSRRLEGAEDEGKEVFRKEDEEKKIIVRKEELWHPDNGGGTVAVHSKGIHQADGAGTAFQKVKVSLADDTAVVLSIEMAEADKTKEKRTREIQVGTDEFNLAGGDFHSSSAGSHKNLSPRIGRLLKHLHEKLDSDERQRKFLEEKINEKLLREEGLFLVRHISPGREVAGKPPEVAVSERGRKHADEEERSGRPREYYCEECLATLRMFEDRNPSVKSMVDKFETIIQLESF